MVDKKNPKRLTELVAAVLLIVLVCWGVKSCGGDPEKQKQKEAVEAEKWKQEELKQPKRQELIQKLIDQGVFQKVEYRERGATIWVDTSFYLLDFDTKQDFCSIVYDYLATQIRDDMVAVTLRDIRSGKNVGTHYGRFGLKME